jgi:glycosyltransferase involved in cell wall biosynthesis
MSAPIRILELRSVWGTGGGPDKTILAGARLSDPARYETTVCYIRDARDDVFALDRRAAEAGVRYEEIVERHSFDRGIWKALRALVRRLRIDIVHAHDHKTDLLTWLLARRDPIIPLSTAHGFAGESRNERFYYAVEKRLLARFPRVIAVSQPIKAELVRTGSRPERVTVINNGIDHRVFVRDPARRPAIRRELGFADGDLVVGAVGRLESEKRFDQLLDAVATLKPAHPSLVLAIAGEGRLRGDLEARIARLGLGGTVRLLGHRTDVIALHHAFDIFVQSSEREGTPNAVLEAMASGLPIVATDVGGLRDYVTPPENGLLTPKGDAAAFAAALLSMLGDADRGKAIGEHNRNTAVRQFSWAASAAEMLAVYQRVIDAFAARRKTVRAAS